MAIYGVSEDVPGTAETKRAGGQAIS